MAEKRIRRTKQEILIDKINKIDESILGLQEKINQLKASKSECEKELEDLANEAKIAKVNELINLMDESGLTIDQLKDMMNKPQE